MVAELRPVAVALVLQGRAVWTGNDLILQEVVGCVGFLPERILKETAGVAGLKRNHGNQQVSSKSEGYFLSAFLSLDDGTAGLHRLLFLLSVSPHVVEAGYWLLVTG